MARFHGKIGYIQTLETAPGVYTPTLTEIDVTGDILRSATRFDPSEHLNDNLNIQNRFSIVASDFALQNLQFIRYIVYFGAKWKVNSVEVQRPRLILTVGGVYNG